MMLLPRDPKPNIRLSTDASLHAVMARRAAAPLTLKLRDIEIDLLN
jgi:hypothetical protein